MELGSVRSHWSAKICSLFVVVRRRSIRMDALEGALDSIGSAVRAIMCAPRVASS